MRNKLIGLALLITGALHVHAQENFSDVLRQKVKSSSAGGPYTIDMAFNQSVYSPGDTAFFSLTVWDLPANIPDAGRQIVDVNLWNEGGTAEVSVRIMVRGMSGSQFKIPVKMKPGRYKLTASFYQSDIVEYQREFNVLSDWELQGATYYPEVYVESGHLIEGVTNWIFVRNRAGLPGRVKDSSGRTVKEFGSGIGWIELAITPRKESYSVEAAGKSIQLPAVESQGFALHVVKDEILVRHGDLPPGTSYYLMLTGKTGAELIKKVNLNDSVSRISVPPQMNGIAQASIVDENYKIWANRWVQREKSVPSLKPSIVIEKNVYNTREKVQAKVSGPSVAGPVTVRVLKKDLFQKYFEAGMQASLNSALAAIAPQPIPGLSQQMKQAEKFLTISGEANYSDTGKPLPDSTVLVLFLQNKLFGYETMVEGGRFSVPLVFDVDGNETVFFSASFRKRDLNNFVIKLDGTIAVKPLQAIASEVTEKQDAYGQYTIRKNVIDRSFSYFAKPIDSGDIDPNSKYIDELSGVDITVEPKQYVTFATMSEVIREILPSLEHRTIKDREVIRLYTTHKRPSNYANPLFIIDGVLTKNAAHFLNIRPADVLYIKIVKDYSKLMHFGLLGDNGIIIVRTRLVEPGFEQENVFPLVGMNRPVRSRLNSGNSASNGKIPDLRPCLYFNPVAKFDDDHIVNLTFFTSDDVGEYIIQVFGRDLNGEAFVTEQSFAVGQNK